MSLVTSVFASISCGGGGGGNGSGSPQLCALLSACEPSGASFGTLCQEVGTTSTFASSSTEVMIEQSVLSCAQGATDCASLDKCLVAPASVAAVCKGSTMQTCSNGWLVQCGSTLDGKTQGTDCSASGLVCGTSNYGASCGAATCDPSKTKPSCDGDNLVTCNSAGSVLQSTDCTHSVVTSCTGVGTTQTCQTLVGNACAVVSGTAQCVGNGAACDGATVKSSCDGTSILSCTGGKQARFDCSTFSSNATCKILNGLAQCEGAGTECTSTTPESCKDGVITYCSWGTKTTLDCKSFGLSGCATISGTARTVAHCTK
jgi:hypothetical protein